jgi:hypothetical protein
MQNPAKPLDIGKQLGVKIRPGLALPILHEIVGWSSDRTQEREGVRESLHLFPGLLSGEGKSFLNIRQVEAKPHIQAIPDSTSSHTLRSCKGNGIQEGRE